MFPGDLAQVGEVRRWVRGLLPESEHQDDVVIGASELGANAVRHTRSGGEGGRFSVEICAAPSWTRVVVGDRGSISLAPHVVPSHGLSVVRALALHWGITGDQNGRYVWADMPRPGDAAAGSAGDGYDEAAVVAGILRWFPGSRVWWGPESRKWWAVPGGSGAAGLTLDAPSPRALARMLAAWHSAAKARPRQSPMQGVRRCP